MNKNADGRLYQSNTTEVRLSTTDGFDYLLQTWSDLKIKYGREKKLETNSAGEPDGWTADAVKTSGGIKIRLDEWDNLEAAWAAFSPTVPICNQPFVLTMARGNTIATLKKDTAAIMFQEVSRDFPRGQDPLMIDHPLLVSDFVENGYRALRLPT